MPRWFERLRAKWGGYFWIACPMCGREFGGHEHWRSIQDRMSVTIWDPFHPTSGRAVCSSECADEFRSMEPLGQQTMYNQPVMPR